MDQNHVKHFDYISSSHFHNHPMRKTLLRSSFKWWKQRLRDISNFFKVTQLISDGVRMEAEPSPTGLQVSHGHPNRPALLTAIPGRRAWEMLLPLPFVLYCLSFLPWTCIIFGDMGTKRKSRKESKVTFATAISIRRWRWTHFKKGKSQKVRGERYTKWLIKINGNNTLSKMLNQCCKQKLTALYRGYFNNMLPKTKTCMSFSPRNLTPRNFSKRGQEVQI